MKTITWISILLIAGWSCNSSSGNGNKAAVLKEDSLDYYPPTPAQISKQEFRRYYRTVSHFFDSTLIGRGFNGSILIAKEGAVIYEAYEGFADLRKKNPLTDTTSTHIASSGKTFTGMAILRLVQENLLSLNDSLEKFFPGFPYKNVTVKMLLNHRSGLPNYVYFMPQKQWKNMTVKNEDVLNYLYTARPNKSNNAGRRFSYSNTNYVLLAMIIEKVTGKSFPEFMKWKFFDPLGMTHTFVYTPADSSRAIRSFAANGSHWDDDHLEGTYGDKNIYTTARDLLKWDQAFYTDQLLSKELQDSAFTPYSHERPGTHNYGLGWRLLTLPNDKKVIYHNGRWHGFNAAFARLTDEKVTIIILGNKYNSRIYRSARDAYDIFGEYFHGDNDEEEGVGGYPLRKSAPQARHKIRNKR